MAKQSIKKSKSFLGEVSDKISAGIKKGRELLNSAPPIGSTGRYGTVAKPSRRKMEKVK